MEISSHTVKAVCEGHTSNGKVDILSPKGASINLFIYSVQPGISSDDWTKLKLKILLPPNSRIHSKENHWKMDIEIRHGFWSQISD